MSFFKKIKKHRGVILDNWFTLAVESYSSETSKFMKNRLDFFENPVGRTIFTSFSNLLDGLIYEKDIKELKSEIDSVVRIKAVQGFSPSMAIGFLFDLKDILREYQKTYVISSIDDFVLYCESKIDELIKVAFDLFVACREQIYDLKANETKNQFFNSLSRAGLIAEI